MKKILYVNTCVRKDSRTDWLARRLLRQLKGEVTERRPHLMGLQPLDERRLARRDALLAAGTLSDPALDVAREFAEADVIVIAAPYWDLSFPAWLKIYLENVTVCGVSFRYTEEGIPEGLCRAETLYYVTTSGGPSPHSFGFAYVDALAKGFYGVGETRLISASGLDVVGADAGKILEEAAQSMTL